MLYAGAEATFTSLAADDGLILLREWSFGDDAGFSVALGPDARHTFARSGVYSVSHRATDNLLQQGIVTRTVFVANTPPVAAFTLSAAQAYRGQVVDFTDASTDRDGTVVSWRWSFGDGMEATTRSASHAYATLGLHNVTLTVHDDHGGAASAAQTLRIVNRPPDVAASMTPEAPRAGETVTFLASAADADSEGELAYAWAFSDGATASGPSVARAFPPGTHEARVRVVDGDGGASVATLAFVVRPA